ncbi:hypothetical protein NO995_09630 [Aestuariibaculum sp. M13]|uniref:hypothetical protein n=1 Tax=Aestuariibaculum sp. M13 TaxID=2967132 RepID=UPI002159E7C3|nr:hypothetical protein [Aestuariibaculum sp. M13]MCR8667941.1 hypothetical protein [Aestuariibaculum sp. M13]
MKLPNPSKDEVLLIRISKKEKEHLKELAKKGKHGTNASEVVRNLIEREYFKK